MLISDWSSDVCSSDLTRFAGPAKAVLPAALAVPLLFAGWGMLAGGRSAPLPETMAVEAPPGWRDARVDGAAWAPRFDGADQRLLRQFANDTGQVVPVAIGGSDRQERKSVVSGTGVSGRLDLGGRSIKKQKKEH